MLHNVTPTTRVLDATLRYGAAQTGHAGDHAGDNAGGFAAPSSIRARHASWTNRSVHSHADLRGGGALSVQTKHSGGSSDMPGGGRRPSGARPANTRAA